MRPRANGADEPDSPAQLKARALRLLARREHSRAELARKLAPRAESAAALERLLDELAHNKQLSDERYAEARAHRLARKYGVARIVHDLRAKGVAEHTAASATAGASADEIGRAREILRRKYALPATTLEERARRARFLQSRGFSHEVIRRVVIIG
ncbi:MAG TPA: recombination regulator RecX [Burkholderiales bacterium]|nr:recombination regulator RecX [Burkholderiales bacterium]